MNDNLFPKEEAVLDPGEETRCTPERLLDFYQECKALTGRTPPNLALRSCNVGVLGPLLDGWELQRRGLI